jgi:hypothetical protein
MMKEMLAKMTGKKTYIVGACMIFYGITGLIIGKHDYNTAADLISQGLAACTIRHAIK